eukprot:superscaffoldBa00002902_g15610
MAVKVEEGCCRGIPPTVIKSILLVAVTLAEEGQPRGEKGRYTLFWKGKPTGEPRMYGVGFAIRNNQARQLKLDSNQMATVVSAYVPTLDSQEDVKEAFYASLDNILSGIPKNKNFILLGDFNARVG